MKLKKITATLLLLIPATSFGFNKCVIDGKTTYSDKPCPDAATSTTVEVATNVKKAPVLTHEDKYKIPSWMTPYDRLKEGRRIRLELQEMKERHKTQLDDLTRRVRGY